jgi:hypothetical protein
MKQSAGKSDDNPCRSTPKAEYDSDTVARSSLGVNLRVQLESIRTNGDAKISWKKTWSTLF